jgi:hypothetical protein
MNASFSRIFTQEISQKKSIFSSIKPAHCSCPPIRKSSQAGIFSAITAKPSSKADRTPRDDAFASSGYFF